MWETRALKDLCVPKGLWLYRNPGSPLVTRWARGDKMTEISDLKNPRAKDQKVTTRKQSWPKEMPKVLQKC